MREIDAIRICHVVFSFDYGGLERRILRLIDGLSPLGAEFTIVSLRPSEGRSLPRQANVRHVVLDARPGLDWRAVGRLARLLREEGTHVVHSHNWVSMLEGIVAGRLARTPVILHGEHGASRFEPAQLQLKRTIAQSVLARFASVIVPVNDSIRDRLCEVWRLSPQRCSIIRNGVDTQRFVPGSEGLRSPIVVGSISRLEKIKNFSCLIRAIHRLNAAFETPRYRLVIVGEGAERGNLERLVFELNAGAYVALPGATDNPAEWYPRFDIYVNSSFSEGMSNTVLESMACGLPVVATDVAGHRDWLEPSTNAVFFKSDDDESLASALAEIASDAKRAQEMGRRNRSRVCEEFSQDRFIEDYVRLYRRSLEARGLYWFGTTRD